MKIVIAVVRVVWKLSALSAKKDQKLSDPTDTKFYLQKDDGDNLTLSHKHAYYYQVQTQLSVCRKEFCYFVVWTEHDIHIEIITLNSDFWEEICTKPSHIFQEAILPELVAKFFYKLPSPSFCSTVKSACTTTKDSMLACGDNTLFCYCEQVESGDMVGCDNDRCDIK